MHYYLMNLLKIFISNIFSKSKMTYCIPSYFRSEFEGFEIQHAFTSTHRRYPVIGFEVKSEEEPNIGAIVLELSEGRGSVYYINAGIQNVLEDWPRNILTYIQTNNRMFMRAFVSMRQCLEEEYKSQT